MDLFYRPSREELLARADRLFEELCALTPDWETAFVSSPENLYYFTGTMQDSLLVFKRNGERLLFVRRNCSRALSESALPAELIRPMASYAQVAATFGAACGVTLLEKEKVDLKMLERMQNRLQLGLIRPLEPALDNIRAVKSEFELALMEEAGRIHYRITNELAPELLVEGISECEFYARLRQRATELGHQGMTRFHSPFAFVDCCQFGFGESTLVPTSFDSPGGMRGMYPAVPFGGSRERRLRPGDLVMVDFGCGVGGYQSDRTQIYAFRELPEESVLKDHARCREICERAASMLKPGISPQEIYNAVMPTGDAAFMKNFMGYKDSTVHFLGHSIGMLIDERPAIARGFTAPLKKNMTFAIEPKKSIPGRGVVGVEDTYVVTEQGGRCITGGPGDILLVP